MTGKSRSDQPPEDPVAIALPVPVAPRITVLTSKVLVETEGLTPYEHERQVQWVINKLKGASRYISTGYTLIVIYDEDGKAILGSESSGRKSTSSDTGEITNSFFDVAS